jgi:hypothetical protein
VGDAHDGDIARPAPDGDAEEEAAVPEEATVEGTVATVVLDDVVAGLIDVDAVAEERGEAEDAADVAVEAGSEPSEVDA